MSRLARFLRQYLRPRPDAVQVLDTTYDRDGMTLPARLYRPARPDVPGGRTGHPLPAWVVLHGLTWHGRKHPTLDRFVRAVAAGGAAVIVPEIPEWSRLRVAPAATGPSLLGAADALRARPEIDPDRIAALGFSFGATQALNALADPAIAGRVRGLAAWGGYADLHRLFRFGLTGEYEHAGARYRTRPDPYGAWIMGANYLARIPGYGDHDDVAAALGRLADESGRRGVFAADPVYDPLKVELRAALPAGKRAVFDAFAPPAGAAVPDPELADWLAGALADAAVRADPLLDPTPRLPRLRVRTLLAHGRDDRLVPFVESLHLARMIPRPCHDSCTITALFAHSGLNASALRPIRLGREAARFAGLLRRLLALVDRPA